MGLALLQEKNLVAAWKQKDTRRSKKRKKNIFSGKKLKRGISNLDLSYIFLTLITGLSKVVLLFAFSYGLFSGYRFITQSPQFDVNRIILVGHKQLSKEELNLWIGSIIGENIFELENIPLNKKFNKIPLILKDVARIELGQEKDLSLSRINGFNSVSFWIEKQKNKDAIKSVDKIKQTVGVFEETLPEELEIFISNDSSYWVKGRFDSMIKTL